MSTSAYDRWVAVSAEAMDSGADKADLLVNRLIQAASAAMAELHLEIARLQRKAPHPSQDFPWRPDDVPPKDYLNPGAPLPRPERVRRYEDRPGLLQGRRGAYAHLDPVTPRAIPGTPMTAGERALYQPAANAALYARVAEEALNLLDAMHQYPGNGLLYLQRAAELRARLDSLGP